VGERIAAAFAAGLVSIAFPCVLPLVPGYLSAITAVEVDRLGEPFALGFTVVFVVLGAGAAALGGWVDQETRTKIAGFVLVVLGLAFMGLLPWPERMLAPGALTRARASGSRALLGAAFAVCAAPCVGVLLGAILALAADSRTVVRGCILLAAYSFGITVAFVLIGIAFTRAMAAFRWVRDHYDWIRYLSGGTLVVLGLLLFFNRDWWLRVLLNRALDALGLGGQL
jgi:cytochrome c-type biogenesis protein